MKKLALVMSLLLTVPAFAATEVYTLDPTKLNVIVIEGKLTAFQPREIDYQNGTDLVALNKKPATLKELIFGKKSCPYR